MADYFFDSSTLVKKYVNETGSQWVSNLLDAAAVNYIYVVRITKVEVASALSRKLREGVINGK